jgi:hypothetical protein
MRLKQLMAMILPLGTAVLFSPDAHAQACLGLPSFAGGSVHLNVAGEFPDSATAYAVGIGAGRQNSLFANLGGGQVSYEGLDEKSSFGFLEFGVQFPARRAQICPIAGGSFGVGPDDDTIGLKVTSSSASAGVAIGLPIAVSALTVIPNAAVKYEYLSVKCEVRDVGCEEEGFGATRETFTSGLLDLGLGFVFRDRLSVQPLVHIPFGGTDEDATFGVFASVSFGWRAR